MLNRPYVARYHHLTPGEVARAIDRLTQSGEFVAGQVTADASPDPEDNIFLVSAVEGKADYVVSGDKKHLLSLREYRGIRILTPKRFVTEVLEAQ